jgi:hypothetical protein
VDPSVGAAVILRPDQYVSWVGAMDDFESLQKFFAGFMLEASAQVKSSEQGAHGVAMEVQGATGNGATDAAAKGGDSVVAVRQADTVVNGAL